MLYALIPLVVSNVIALAMVFIILLAHAVPRQLRFTLIATILSLVLWQDNIYFADQITNNLVLWNTTIFIWPTTAIVSCYSFIRYLHTTQVKTNEPSKFIIPMTIATIIQIIPIVTLNIFNSVIKSNDGLEITRSLGYYVYLVGLLIALGCLFAEIFVRRATSGRRTQEHQAINVVLVTVIIATAYGIIVNVLIPLFTGGQNYINFGVVIIDIFAVGLWLSITRSKLLDIRFYAIRTVVYVLSFATLVVVYGLLAYGISQWLLGYDTSSLQSLVNIGLALVLAFIFQPVRRFFDRLTSRIFYRDSYDKDVFYAELSHALTSTTELRELLERASEVIARTLKAEQVIFYIWYGEHQHVSAGTVRHGKLPVADIDVLTDHVVASGGGVVVGSLIENNIEVKRMFISHRIEVALPLVTNDAKQGFLLLGDPKSSGYSRRDIGVLESVSGELTIAIRNALSVQDIKELNDNLQQRVNDATKELRASNAQLRRLDQAKDEFVSMASHQLRTPLTSVKGYISMVMEGDVGKISDSQKHLLGEAFTSSERMVHLINDFLNVSRLQTGKFLIDKRPVDLAKLVGQEIDSLATTAASRQLTFAYKAPKNVPILNLDEGKMQQVIMNFADNALYYSTESTKIAIKLAVEGKDVVFTVKDTGIGVPKSEQSQLFSKFYRASNARKQRPDGTGVGLFLAKKVIDAHGGSVVFDSVEGKGSTFGFRLPIESLRAGTDTN
jgi:signal transduction histidine kinase